MTTEQPKYPQSNAYAANKSKHKALKERWAKFRDSKLVLKFRESKLNPYHRNLNFYDAPREEAILAAREKGEKTILCRGENGRKTRCYVELDCSVEEEIQKYGNVFRGGQDVTDRIPHNKDGKPDLFAEDPIIVAIVPVEGPSAVGHVCMQYKDKVVNRRSHCMDSAPIWPLYGLLAQYYAVYPSELGIEPKELVREMEKANIREEDDAYNVYFHNCATMVAGVFKSLGVKDIDMFGPDKLGLVISTPGNNPFGLGMRNWCQKHGVHLRPQEMLDYKYGNFKNSEKQKEEYAEVRARYKSIVNGKRDRA